MSESKGKRKRIVKKKDPSAIAIDEFGFRTGTMKSKAAAMYAHGAGATLSEVKGAVGQIQYNVLTQLEKKGFKINRIEDDAGNRKVTRYFVSR